jgi:uncharacterized protein (TIGR04222 family)
MRVALASDTWGILGPTFVAIYLAASVAAVAATLRLRRRVRAGNPPQHELRPIEIAYLAGGPEWVLYTTIVALRMTGAIEPRTQDGLHVAEDENAPGEREVPAPEPATDADAGGAGDMIMATLLTIRFKPGCSRWDLSHDRNIAKAVDRIRQRLVHTGLLLGEDAKRSWKLTLLPVWLVVAVGAGATTLAAAGLNGAEAVGYLSVMLALVLTGLLLRRSPGISTRAGEAALAQLRTEHRHLAPDMSPAWESHDPVSVVTAAALYGPEILLEIDEPLYWSTVVNP